MQTKIFAIYDEKAEVYSVPFFQINDATAIRTFQAVAQDQNSTISKNPSDYKLYHVGGFDDRTGIVMGLDVPKFVCNSEDSNGGE